jgi:NAD-dependent dihydropyrimidine dehydrogenase PreA subunit
MKRDIYSIFSIPKLKVLDSCLELIIPSSEQKTILEIALQGNKIKEGDRADTDILYRRGIINIADDNTEKQIYKLSDFYTRLEVFVITEFDKWIRLEPTIRQEIDNWYFETYYNRLHISAQKAATEDIVATLNETLNFIDKENRQAYLSLCDCRALANKLNANSCGKPLETCVSFKNGANTNANRGILKPISKDEAKNIIFQADKAGLIHRINSGTICNCCIDCCYLSRAQNRRNESIDFYNNINAQSWPIQTKKVILDLSMCINCKKCIERCPYNLFSMQNDKLHNDNSLCIGCGLCVTTCPSGSLKLKSVDKRNTHVFNRI